MNSSEESDKKINKTKSFNIAPSLKMKCDAAKRKSFNVNEAVKHLDLDLVRLKKSKLVNGECVTALSTPTSHSRRGYPDMFMDVSSNSNFCSGMENSSLMSMNFSHYELVRNLSDSVCNSEGAFSSTTCNACMNSPDIKNEHLERYFRSVEIWSQKFRGPGPSCQHLNGPNK